jgi:putative membrane protein
VANVKASVILGAFIGVALGVCIFIYYGLKPICEAFAVAGWTGLAALCAVHLISVVLCALAWQLILVEAPPRATLAFLWVRWLRDSTGNLLAILPAAGEVIAARELTFYGIRLSLAGATTIIDLTIEILTQLLFTLLGLGLLLAQRPSAGSAWWAAGGLAIATLAVVGFICAQRNGLFRILQKLPVQFGLRRPFESLVEVVRIDAAIQQIYRHPIRIAGSVMLHFTAWIAGAAETWLGLWLMGHPLSFPDALVIESLVFALRTAAFAIPWAAGVQESGYLMLGALFGLRPDVSLALALLKRAREVIIGVPALLAWQAVESRRFCGGADNLRRTPLADTPKPRF